MSNIFDQQKLDFLINHFSIPATDVLLIAINRFGINADVCDKRLRFKLKLDDYYETFYMAVCINTFDSPFSFDSKGYLYLNKEKIGKIFDIEQDTCDTTYFRRARTELTLNSNMRSQCQGCTFCGTYNLEPEDKIEMSTEEQIAAFLDGYLKTNHLNNLSDLVRVTVCTGCFADELRLVEHIIKIHKVFSEYGFNKRIRYIGSQIRTDEAMDIIQKEIPFFSLSLTVECFTNRKQRMRKEKANLEMDAIKDIMKRSLEHNFSTNYLYILGLDELDSLENGIKELSNYVNRFPVFQVMQNYVEAHEKQRVKDAVEMDYYLSAREKIEDIFKDMALKPRSWENYRGLFYTSYQKEPFNCIRI